MFDAHTAFQTLYTLPDRVMYGKVHTAHVARLRFYADADLNITAEIKDVFHHSYAQGECRMNALMHVAAVSYTHLTLPTNREV